MKRTKAREVAPGILIPQGFTVLSAAMFKFACEMARQSEVGDFRPRVAYPMATVIHATSCLEGFLNEELEKIVTTWGADLESTIESLERLDLTKKWVLFPRLLHGKTFDVGTEPYQSFCGLVDLRNSLVHYRPVATADFNVPKKLESLGSKFEFDPCENTDWPNRVLTPSCARWACTTARNMVREYFHLSGRAKDWPALEQMSWRLSLDSREA